MVTPEDLKNMSPEELQKLQQENCIFCHIISGKVQSKKIYEDEICIGILDINPANPGHVLIIPKKHYAIMPQINDNDLAHMFFVAKKVSKASLKALGSTGTNIFVANGTSAGQKAQHFMIHVIPRKEKDGLKCFQVKINEVNKKDFDETHQKLLNAIQGKPENTHNDEKDDDFDLDNISDILK